MTRLSHVLAAVHDRPWFIRQTELIAIAEIARAHAAGPGFSDDEIRDRLAAGAAGNGPRRGARMTGAVAVLPIYGPIVPRASMMTEMSGATSIESIRGMVREALADDAVGSILFDVDSPGGMADGVEELATEIRDARGSKPMTAIAHYGMASAAYYLASQADEIVASPSSEVGWIGTVMVHQEVSRMADAAGVTTTIIRDPEGKFGGNEFEPLSAKALTELQQTVEDLSAQFHAAVAKGRGVSIATVRKDFGQGGGMTAKRALAAGLVDRVESFEATVGRLAAGRGPRPRVAAVAIGADVLEPAPAPVREAEAALALARARTAR